MSGEPDGTLLDRFVASRDETAFAELVRRLGPIVYGVCRRHLGHSDDAEDAFQATFLVFVRKAAAVQPGRVAAWVLTVASLTARRARLARSRRLRRETDPRAAPAPVGGTDTDLGSAIDEELGRLPDRYRLPIVLCGLRGLSAASAAAELGWPVGTVASRLSRGRAELARRLAARGIAVGLLATAVGWAELTAAVPTRLMDITAATVGGNVSPTVVALTTEVVNAMTWSPIRRLTAGLLAASAVALGGGVILSLGQAAPVPASTEVSLPAASAPAPKVLAVRPDKDGKMTLIVYRTQKVVPGGPGAGPGAAPGFPGAGGPPGAVAEMLVPVMAELSEVKDLKVSTASGKTVEVDEAVKRLTKGGVVIVSADGKAIDSAYLKAFKDDVLVLVADELAPKAMAAAAAAAPGR